MTPRNEGFGVRFLPGLATLPTFSASLTLALYLADWPDTSSAGMAAIALAGGIGLSVVVSLLFFGSFTRIESAVGDTYDQLVTRTIALRARIDALRPEEGTAPPTVRPAAATEAARMIENLEEQLRGGQPGSVRWLMATGYVNLWRRVHRAEEALLELAGPEKLHLAAMTNRRLLARSGAGGASELARALDAILKTPPGRGKHNATSGRQEAALAALDTPCGRALVREAQYRVHAQRNDLWDKLVNLRNRLVATLFLTTIGLYALLLVAVLGGAEPGAVTAAAVLFTVGAGVGLFRELHATSHHRGGVVFDYGLGYARLLTVPVLSGTAAIGGVVLTRLAADSGTEAAPLGEIFSLTAYPLGLLVAAVFGLTPGLLIERLRNRTDEYKAEIQSTAAPAVPATSEPATR